MGKLQYKTNINCSACVSKVTPILDGNTSIENWEVDTKNPSKVLTLEGSNIQEEEVIASLAKIGYKAEKI